MIKAVVATDEMSLTDIRARVSVLDDIIATEKNVIHRLMYIQERINLREKMHHVRIREIHHRRHRRV